MHLAGAHVVVTGATRGIGLALADAFAAAGATITAVARPGARLDALTARSWRTLAVDLSVAAEVDGLIERAASTAGPVDVLINNAGLNRAQVLAGTDARALRSILTTNLVTPMELIRQVLPFMLERRHGAVVNISSVAGELALRNQVPYCASKSGLTHATRALQRELKNTGVSAHPVVLGLVATDMIDDCPGIPSAHASLVGSTSCPRWIPPMWRPGSCAWSTAVAARSSCRLSSHPPITFVPFRAI